MHHSIKLYKILSMQFILMLSSTFGRAIPRVLGALGMI